MTNNIEYCSNHELLEAYRDHWKRLSLDLMQKNTELEKDRDRWKRLFLQMYAQWGGVTDEMMWAYRDEMGKA